MKLYTAARAPNPRRVRWVMAEKGIEGVELIDYALHLNEHKNDALRAVSPMLQVPTLVLDDGTAITESLAICRYLEALHPEPNLFGTDARETAVIEMWTRRVEMYCATPLMLAVRHLHPALAAIEKQNAETGEGHLKSARRMIALLETRLGESPYIAAERLTIADIVAFAAMDFARMIRWRPDPETQPNLAHWYEGMRARPAAAAV
jgi:glutathione S-transferase